MKLTAIIVVAFFGIAYAGHIHSSDVELVGLHGDYSGHSGHGHGALSSIALGSAHEAYSAAASQIAAGEQASFAAKSALAQSALQASATAQAALAGKEALVQNLEYQSADAHQILDGEVAQLGLSSKTTEQTEIAVQLAAKQVSELTAALNSAQAVLAHAQEAASNAATSHGSQKSMVGQAKGRLSGIDSQLGSAQADLADTIHAAEKASAAAHVAQNNAAHGSGGHLGNLVVDGHSSGHGYSHSHHSHY